MSGGIATELRDRIYSGQKDLESGMAIKFKLNSG